mmetsp:Transcript_3561/g.15908  ORF Transcript_3561/g.15908 Transcript_3561/m.15908 type:complete len:303 (-) Transcript_3561:20-928(-)
MCEKVDVESRLGAGELDLEVVDELRREVTRSRAHLLVDGVPLLVEVLLQAARRRRRVRRRASLQQPLSGRVLGDDGKQVLRLLSLLADRGRVRLESALERPEDDVAERRAGLGVDGLELHHRSLLARVHGSVPPASGELAGDHAGERAGSRGGEDALVGVCDGGQVAHGHLLHEVGGRRRLLRGRDGRERGGVAIFAILTLEPRPSGGDEGAADHDGRRIDDVGANVPGRTSAEALARRRAEGSASLDHASGLGLVRRRSGAGERRAPGDGHARGGHGGHFAYLPRSWITYGRPPTRTPRRW